MHKHENLWIVLTGASEARLFRHRCSKPGHFEALPLIDGETGEPDRLAATVNEAAALGLFDALVLVGPPPALAALKRSLRPAVCTLVIREASHDLLALREPARVARLLALLRTR